LLDLAQEKGARFLLASTAAVYGDPEQHPLHESYRGHVDPVGPRSVREEAMRFAEAMAMAFSRNRGTVVRIARVFNTYGPGMRLDDGRVIPKFIVQALRGKPLTVYGTGSQTRSFCYVNDLVTGLLALLWSDVEGPVNLGAPDELSVLKMAHLAIRHTGSSSTILHLPPPGEGPDGLCPSIERARVRLGWEPRTTLRQGIANTVLDLAERLEVGESRPLESDRLAERALGGSSTL
jgi:dTDP-glucose 4,6-dehydratase